MSRLATTSLVNWWATIPQFLVLGAACIFGLLITKSPRGVVWGAAIYLAYSFASRSLLARAHRRGVRLSRNQQFAAAIPAHQASYDFFARHAWLDRYRAITMMSASAMSYREMALCNIAFAYTQIGEGAKAKQFYQRALSEFPGSTMAAAALRMIDASERAVQNHAAAE
jgi:hypothetical protein